MFATRSLAVETVPWLDVCCGWWGQQAQQIAADFNSGTHQDAAAQESSSPRSRPRQNNTFTPPGCTADSLPAPSDCSNMPRLQTPLPTRKLSITITTTLHHPLHSQHARGWMKRVLLPSGGAGKCGCSGSRRKIEKMENIKVEEKKMWNNR